MATDTQQLDFHQFLIQQMGDITAIPTLPEGGFDFTLPGTTNVADFQIDPSLDDISAFLNLDGDMNANEPGISTEPALDFDVFGEDIFSPFPADSGSSPSFEDLFPVSPFNQRGTMTFGTDGLPPAPPPVSPPHPGTNPASPDEVTPTAVNPSQTFSSPEEHKPPVAHPVSTPNSIHGSHSPSPAPGTMDPALLQATLDSVELSIARLQRPVAPMPKSRAGRLVTRASAAASTGLQRTLSIKPGYTEPLSVPGKRKRTKDEDEDYDSGVKRGHKHKRSKSDLQDGDVVRGWACPYPHHPGSAAHCNVLLGTEHEIPRHLVKHLIEEEDRLRDDPALDRATLVFGGAPANRPVCELCKEEFSRWDAWERHSTKARLRGFCSTPVGMHGKHAVMDTFDTGGAAQVKARIKVSGEKRFISEIVEIFSIWSDRYRFKNVRGGRERQPEWLTTSRGPVRNMVTAYTPWTAPP
ncbi:hypothetical protein CALVIDRAFT_526051 [Calocera viscosa TUFC12733]|uniref:Uncharacterized protein n=1 Tax=Calocera viscosa (strain TUFC12733) TaxID=1330018 RepID=A0A167PBH0_CALVF|nr:hypothetical protein CALVIDRAFT_526051 [Calocera viscosa TUFC12733]